VDKYQITITVDGMPDDDGHIRLNHLVEQLQKLNKIIRGFDESVSDGQSTNYVRVVGLSHSSPIKVETELVQKPGAPDNREAIQKKVNHTFSKINQGQIPYDIEPYLLDDIRDFIKPLGRNISAMSVKTDKEDIVVNEDFIKVIESALAEETAIGTIVGKLEWMNIHNNNVFNIYPLVGPKKVKCKFPSALREEVCSAAGRKVELAGKLKYWPSDDFPHEMDVKEITIYPSDDELPKLADLRGTEPNITGDESIESYFGKMRDAWK